MTNADVGAMGGVMLGGLAGSQFGRGSGRIVGAAVGAVAGGVIGGQIGRSLDAKDRELAGEAEYDALENGRPGEPLSWRNASSGRFGDVVPEAPYQRAGIDCRNFSHTVYFEGRSETVRRSACRDRDGRWAMAD